MNIGPSGNTILEAIQTFTGAKTFNDILTVTQVSANKGILASTGYSLTGSNATSMIDLAGTWNTTGTPTAIKLDVTNTASNAASLLMNLLVGSDSKFKVGADGIVTAAGGYKLTGTGLPSINNGSGFHFRFGMGSGSATFDLELPNSSTYVGFDTNNAHLSLVPTGTGRVGVCGVTAPTALVHISAGTATASTAPLKFTAGTNLTVAEAGAMEWDGTDLFITKSDGTRKTLASNVGYHELVEMTAPAGAANSARVFTQDNGAGKTQLMVIFGSGVAQQVAIEA